MVAPRSELNSAKANFDAAYAGNTPVPYIKCMSSVGYEIPQNARPVFEKLIRLLEHERRRRINVLDLGTSYGINVALLRYNIDLQNLYRHYLAYAHLSRSPERLSEVDRYYFDHLPQRLNPYVIGLDASANAISYASGIGLLDHGLALNLEDEGSNLRGELLDVDIIISTGTIGYVGPRTLSRILDFCRNPNDVWIACFVLRLVDFAPYEAVLGSRGMQTETVRDLFTQRRLLDEDEYKNINHYAAAQGLCAQEYMQGSRLLSQFYLSRTHKTGALPLSDILKAVPYPTNLSA